ncbi:protein-L-isoaspartate O-methyltransferase domain-containing protein 1-like [Daktulosphaira vitifoliae]|uniref:protein-L-isoaspartate O-methyltransferase domain-containing protein 1-like n=1 Tax=Daktulosphaira vitifoliae TaxID=58002 RepID=UPI0021A9DAED|nr:protein-L-isoaspartate O-methyltransferase domain-containing protein 1-like [Daktulosphaira vitifoliae]
MGQNLSLSRSNDDLINMLIGRKYIRSIDVERVFRSVDRGFYYTSEQKLNAYTDSAWQYEQIHLSSPCIYAKVMECLGLKSGNKFLNIGSGIGYLSTVAGLLLGSNGVNHGIEIHQSLIDSAYKKLEEFKLKAAAIDFYDFCEPIFVQGNACELLPIGFYDRVYCGAGVPPEESEFMKSLINIGGIIVMPLEGYLMKITRIEEHSWESSRILEVSFTDLIVPEKCSFHTTEFPSVEPITLQELCRFNIRSLIRENLNNLCPSLPIRTKCTVKNEDLPPDLNEDIYIDPVSQFVNLRFGSEVGIVSLHNIIDGLVDFDTVTDSVSDSDEEVSENIEFSEDYDESGEEERSFVINENESLLEIPEQQSDDSTKRKSPDTEFSDKIKAQTETNNSKRLKMNESNLSGSIEPSTSSSSHNNSDMWETMSTGETSPKSATFNHEDSEVSWFSSIDNEGEESEVEHDCSCCYDSNDSEAGRESKVETIMYKFVSESKENEWSKLLKEKINELPIPVSLKNFLNYNRVD